MVHVLCLGGFQSNGRVVGKIQECSESHHIYEEEEWKHDRAALHRAEISGSAVLRQRQGNGRGRRPNTSVIFRQQK